MTGHRRQDHAADHHVAFESPAMAAFAELEAEVLAGLATQAVDVVEELSTRQGVEVRRVLDLGCGPGVGTCCLAERFGSATVVAVDGSATMLRHAAARAGRLGFGERVETALVEMPSGLGALGRADLAWSSMALHHVGDEAAALGRIRELLEPGGLLAVVEGAGPLRVLPGDADLGRPGMWERIDAAWAAWFTDMRADLPGATTSADYPVMLEGAGLEVVADELLTLVLHPPLDVPARRFASEYLRRTQEQLAPYAGDADLDALGGLIGKSDHDGGLRGDDVRLHAARRLYVGRAMS
jgi:SAM-dependent methyltransferase